MSAERLPTGDAVAVASFWFNRRRAGEMSERDAHALELWLGENDAHQAAFADVERMWAQVGGVEDDPAIMDMHNDVQRNLDAQARRRVAGALAAGVLLTAAGGWAAMRTGMISDVWLVGPPPLEFRTSVGQRTTVTLPDRSIVMLDTDTVLRAKITMWERRIELDRGQAFFEVAKDKSRPFIVAAAGRTVRATGTAFDVRVEPQRFEVTLIEGRVRVQEEHTHGDENPGADMRAGWRLAVGADRRWRMEPVDLDNVTAWHSGSLTFYYDPLETAVAEMNRYAERKIVFQGAPPNVPVLGNFRAGDLDNFVKAIELNKLARVVRETEGEIVIAAR